MGRPAVGVEFLEGRPCLVLADDQMLTELAALVDQVNAARVHKGLLPLVCAKPFTSAARTTVALLAMVPQTEPMRASSLPTAESWVTAEAAAERLGVTTRAVTKRAASGGLKAKKIAGRWWIDMKEISDAAA